jgi:hypothetical protein
MMGQLQVYEKFVGKQMVVDKPSLPSLTYKYFIHPTQGLVVDFTFTEWYPECKRAFFRRCLTNRVSATLKQSI